MPYNIISLVNNILLCTLIFVEGGPHVSDYKQINKQKVNGAQETLRDDGYIYCLDFNDGITRVYTSKFIKLYIFNMYSFLTYQLCLNKGAKKNCWMFVLYEEVYYYLKVKYAILKCILQSATTKNLNKCS